MKKLNSLALLATLLMVTQPATAQDNVVDYVLEACKTDLEQFCPLVTPGNGRILHCMAAHADKISGRCEFAFYQAAALLEELTVALAYFAQECETDIENYCSEVEAGDGRILACLDSHAENVSDSCKQAVVDILGQ